MSSYDAIASLYDPWSRSVTEDVDFYVAEARKSGGPVVELGVGTGRIAVPVAAAGVRVVKHGNRAASSIPRPKRPCGRSVSISSRAVRSADEPTPTATERR